MVKEFCILRIAEEKQGCFYELKKKKACGALKFGYIKFRVRAASDLSRHLNFISWKVGKKNFPTVRAQSNIFKPGKELRVNLDRKSGLLARLCIRHCLHAGLFVLLLLLLFLSRSRLLCRVCARRRLPAVDSNFF